MLTKNTSGKDSPSSFKLLTASVRKLRNTLEEVEEIYDDFRTLGPDDLKLLNNVLKASETLQQLDQALNNHRSSFDIRESDVADLKTSLDVIVHQLGLAFDAVTTGEIPLQLDTSIRAGLPTRGPSTSSYTGDSALGRKSSQASSVWSSAQKDSPSLTDTGSEFEDAKPEPKSIKEKEVRDFRRPSFQSLSPTPSSAASEVRKPWSAFGSLDPLSVSFEEASAYILTPDDEDYPISAVRSRSGTGSTVFTQVPATEPVESTPISAPDVGTGDVASDATREDNSAPVDLQSEVTISPPDSPSLARAQGQTLPLPPSPPRPERAVSIDVPPSRLPEVSYLSPASAATPAARRSRAESLSKKSLEDVRTEVTPEVVARPEDNVEVAEAEDVEAEGSKSDTDVAIQPEDNDAVDAASLNQTDITITEPQPPARTSTPPPPTTLTSPPLSPARSPPVPNRRPPPPPPRPRRSKTVKAKSRASSYRIVNASPVDDESSEDDLYTVSRPTSTAQWAAGPPVLPVIPQVSVADHDASPAKDDATDPLDLFQQARTESSEGESTVTAPVIVEATEPIAKNDVHVPTAPEPQPSPTIAIDDHSDQDTSAVEEKKPALPKRPSWIRKASDRPHIASMVSNVASRIQKTTSVYLQKETVPEPGLEVRSKFDVQGGLEVNDGIRTRQSSKMIRERKSVDVPVITAGQLSSTQIAMKPSTPDVRDRSASTSQIPQIESAPVLPPVTGWYGPGTDTTELTDLDRERINHIVHFWNDAKWEQAELYLSDYLSSLLEENQLARARRVQHLLGVSASLRGEWDRAIPLLLSAMRRPIKDISDLDNGDCAAAYWLGDIYALSNQRTEALLAYCIAERSSFFHDENQAGVSTLIGLEQEAVQLGASKAELTLRWSQTALNTTPPDDPRSILDTTVIIPAAAQMLLENEPRKYGRPVLRDGPFQLDGNRFRSNAFFLLTPHTQVGYFHRLKINANHFEPNTPWPLLYDPTFSITNVQAGRLLAYECDLLNIFTTNDTAKVAKSTAKSFTQVNCFTVTDLLWLVRTIRSCLRLYEMQWSEVANPEGTWFLVRYSFMLNKIATTYYFPITIFKQTLRPGFGVEIAADTMGSSRVIRTTYEYEKGVHSGEGKRVRKLVRDFLEEAARGKRKSGGVETEVPPVVAEQEERPPPIPPRPKPAAG